MTAKNFSLSPLDKAIRMNNEGAQLLTRGIHQAAIDYFKNALAAFSLASVSDDEENKDISTNTFDSSELLTISQITVPGLEDAWFYVFKKAFVLQTNCALPIGHLHLASTATLLNLCLAFHCELAKDGVTVAKVHKVCRLYEMAYQMLETKSGSLKEQHSISVMKILVLNNLSHIAFHFNVEDQATTTRLLQSLHFDLTQLAEAKSNFVSFVVLDPVIVHEITANTICVPLLQGSYKASTPAA